MMGFRGIVTVALGIVAGLVAVELLYRVYLHLDPPPQYSGTAASEALGVLDRSRWEYDAELGYVYPAGRDLHVTGLQDGQVTSCEIQDDINEIGNIGPIIGDYDAAELKVLLFGDSFPAFIVDGQTFPNKLQERLTASLGIPVHVVNFGRDGVGILQMMDLAAATVPEWQPDLVVFTFISDDLDRARIWRTVSDRSGFPRVLVTDRPDPDPPLSQAQDVILVEPRATPEWCRGALARGGGDPLASELEERFQRIAEETARREYDLLSPDHSFVLALLASGDPFRMVFSPQPWPLPRSELQDYAEDERFPESLALLEGLGVPFLFIHLPLGPELAAGAYQVTPAQQALWQSLERLAPGQVHELKDAIPPLDDPLKMSFSATNHHPSLAGMQIYAEGIAEVLAKAGLLPQQEGRD